MPFIVSFIFMTDYREAIVLDVLNETKTKALLFASVSPNLYLVNVRTDLLRLAKGICNTMLYL